jgi:hypothetical protein
MTFDSAYTVRRTKPVRGGGYLMLAIGRLAGPFAAWLRSGRNNPSDSIAAGGFIVLEKARTSINGRPFND